MIRRVLERAPGAALLVPAALALAAYARVLHGEFQFDDVHSVVENVALKDLGRFLREQLLQGFAGGGRPVADLTFALNYATSGLATWSYHATNVAIHLGVVFALFALTRRALRLARLDSTALPVVVAGIFALHPMHAQAVSYVCQRAESLASLFYLLVVLLLLKADEALDERRPWRLAYAGAVLALGLGLGTKAIVATAPVAFVLLRVALAPREPGRSPLRRAALLAAPLLVLVALHAGRFFQAIEGDRTAGFSVPGMSPLTYATTQPGVLLAYLRLLAWPDFLQIDHDWRVPAGLSDPRFLLPAAGVAALLAGAAVAIVRGRERFPGGAECRLAGAGTLWFFLVLAPTSSVVPLADVIFDHRPYLASWGIFLAAGAILAALARRWPPLAGVAPYAVVALWAALTVGLHARNAVWESKRALWEDAVAKAPGKARPYVSLGHAYGLEGRFADEISMYARALELGDGSVSRAEVLRNLGAALLRSGRRDEAAGVLESALVQAPADPELMNNLAIVRLEQGDVAAARALASRALAVRPAHGDSANTMGEVGLAVGDAREALGWFERAVQLDPDVASRHWNLAIAAEHLQELERACRAFREYVRLSGPIDGADGIAAMRRLGCDRGAARAAR